MKEFNLAVHSLEENVYKNYRALKEFENLEENRIEYLLCLAHRIRNEKFDDLLGCNYIRVLQFLKKPEARIVNQNYIDNFNLYFKNYDELYFFLINVLDPECNMYKYYLQHHNKNIRNKMEDKFGFYNEKFLYLENKYIQTFYKEFIHNINKDYTSMLVLLSACDIEFKIDKERILEISELSKEWNNKQKSIDKLRKVQSCIFNATTQNKLLKLNNNDELMLFIILSIDPEFRMLQIYVDECTMESIEKKCIEEIGAYSKCLVKLEKKLLDMCITNNKINDWENNNKKRTFKI